MSNNKANQVRKLSQSFFAPFPSRSDPSEQELLASDGDFKPRTQAKHTERLKPPQGYTVINRPVHNGFASPSYVQLLVPLKVKTGLNDGVQSEILSGLNEGDEVVLLIKPKGDEASAATNPFGGGMGRR